MAARTAFIVASVPELAKRTRSMDGVRSTIRRASSVASRVGAAKPLPRRNRSQTASTTGSGAWPSTAAV
jgi:hypothetical protein